MMYFFYAVFCVRVPLLHADFIYLLTERVIVTGHYFPLLTDFTAERFPKVIPCLQSTDSTCTMLPL